MDFAMLREDKDELIPYKGELWRADPNCKHEIYLPVGGGVKCRKCPGWYCA